MKKKINMLIAGVLAVVVSFQTFLCMEAKAEENTVNPTLQQMAVDLWKKDMVYIMIL